MENRTGNILDSNFAGLMLESMADGVFTLDERGRITSWNPSMERITGYTAQEAMGQPCMIMGFSRCFSRSCPISIEECGIYVHGALDFNECFLRHKDGHDVPVVKSARLVRDENGTVNGVVETVTDLSELEKARRRAEEASQRLREIHRFDNIIGKSHPMIQVFSAIRAAAASEATILLQGETGTGKELVAGAIHYNSHRAQMPFVPVSCSALSESLLESELFGHVKGAFTGSVKDRKGRFELADGGTIFLDEVADLTPSTQVKLLRVLQEGTFEPVGSDRTRTVDVRVLSATNKDLEEEVRARRFRDDLFYRLCVVPLRVPSLRERADDIPLLADHFLLRSSATSGGRKLSISDEVMEFFRSSSWPGNVRELQNVLQFAWIKCKGDVILVEHLPPNLRLTGVHAGSTIRRRRGLTVDTVSAALDETRGNKTEAAKRLGVSRATLYRFLDQMSL